MRTVVCRSKTLYPGLRDAACQSGFTLIDLLVTITIIAILIALSLPSFSKINAKAKRLECLSRLKQLNYAMMMYVQENNGQLPQEGYDPYGQTVWNNWTQVQESQNLPVWYNVLPKQMTKRQSYTYAWPPAERKYFYKKDNIIQCPGAKFPSQVYRPNYLIAQFSIAMNSKLINYGYGSTVKMDVIEKYDTTKVVLFMDNRLEGEKKVHPAQPDVDLGQPAGYATRFSPRHGDGGNLAFADGHASWFQGKHVVETRSDSFLAGGAIMPATNIIWQIEDQ